MKLKHLESALQSVTTYSELGTDNVNIELEQYRYESTEVTGHAAVDLSTK